LSGQVPITQVIGIFASPSSLAITTETPETDKKSGFFFVCLSIAACSLAHASEDQRKNRWFPSVADVSVVIQSGRGQARMPIT
jgi:hypothetical protein